MGAPKKRYFGAPDKDRKIKVKVVRIVKPFAEAFYKSKAWHRTRSAYKNKVFGLCERCHGVGKIVHHKIHLTPENINDPAIALSFDNLEYLCQDCHNREHRCNTTGTRDGLIFTADGQLVQIDSRANNGEV